MEGIACGERILEYAVETLAKDGTWQTLCTGECVGHKRIEQFDAVVTSKIRLRAISTKATLDSAPERNRSAQERGV